MEDCGLQEVTETRLRWDGRQRCGRCRRCAAQFGLETQTRLNSENTQVVGSNLGSETKTCPTETDFLQKNKRNKNLEDRNKVLSVFFLILDQHVCWWCRTTLAFSKKQSRNKIFVMLADAGRARISVGTFSCFTFPVCVRRKRALIGRLVCSVNLLTSCESLFIGVLGVFLLFCNLNCCLRELLGVFFLYSLPACVQSKYDKVSQQRRAPPAGLTGINYWGLLPPPKKT